MSKNDIRELYSRSEKLAISIQRLNKKGTGGETSVITDNSGNVKFEGNGRENSRLKANVDLSSYVTKITGKGLSTNDFTTAEKTKLESLSNYNLSTASATEKGGAKVGNTLKITNEVLDVNIDEDTLYLENGKLKAKQSSGGNGGSNIITYTHSGNKEVIISSIDYTTNTFTSDNHSLVDGNRVAFNKTIDCNILTQTPFNNGWNVDNSNGGWFVVGATTNTFQLSLTNTGTPITLTERSTVDLTKWKIEVCPSAAQITVNNINAISLKIDIIGATFRNTRYLLNNTSIYSGYRTRNNETTVSALTVSDGYSLTSSSCIYVNVLNGLDYIDITDNTEVLLNGKINATRDIKSLLPIRTTAINNIPSLNFNMLKPMNGTKIIIEKIA